MTFTLPQLPYDYKALEPFIDEETMRIHHTKHHQAYVDNLNKALEGVRNLQDKSIEDLLTNVESIPADIRQAVINHGGGHYNHSVFWGIMGPNAGGEPEGELTAAIKSTFGSFDKFKEEMTKKAMSVFGSGWAWLVVKDGKLELTRNSFQNAPITKGEEPIVGIDVWEHAYYLKYQNRRVEYVEAWWNLVNWRQAERRFAGQTK